MSSTSKLFAVKETAPRIGKEIMRNFLGQLSSYLKLSTFCDGMSGEIYERLVIGIIWKTHHLYVSKIQWAWSNETYTEVQKVSNLVDGELRSDFLESR